ncbi:MAG: AIR synthase-related protein, partial [Candidatus Woesearchaeota archaeon]|nr:AIR synthase-related protein [Candidatus Woesearchaeota archaeon]
GAQGTKPIAFTLYVAGNTGQKQLDDIVARSNLSCNALGLTHLKPIINLNKDVYTEGEVDIAGTVLGVIDSGDLITGKNVNEGDVIIGLSTDCLMTNGYSLARKYREMLNKDRGHDPESKNIPGLIGTSVNDELRKTHRPYTDILFGTGNTEGILSVFKGKIKATAHITGGGQKDNIPRMVPAGLCAEVTRGVLPLPPIVEYFRHYGADMEAMCEAFNMGVGYTVTVDSSVADQVVKYINKHFRHAIPGVERAAEVIGMIKPSQQGERFRYAAN